ncbi:L-fuconolactonase [Anseongella ginsenosidimutans]|uniref:L-fuconolactonase n=1 Tax=Anseongella ginsenosidimutans TaxID=496056 RepID=A0A4R3KXG9_9SPHI|nr:amidohydrolase family protein [Anseongella ginsenosidimutans]QEC51223.1 amidohydrolase family protein [Anseongella ginsenosidimutans]TCS90101.1 L-fuconolactonase [Anseongella ginsenosidimutans]
MIIDSHQHFWHFDPVRDSWITDEMQAIRQDFLPEDLLPVYRENGIDACVAVQAAQSEEETRFLLRLAEEHDFIKGVVGWIDLLAPDVEERLAHFSQYKKLKGFRHIVQAEPEGFMLQEAFLHGIGKLEKFGYTYDIVIYPNQLDDAIALVKQFPDQKFVLDHIAKPYIRQGIIYPWDEKIRALARFDNIYCKVSGLVTEADHKSWKEADIKPYLDVVFDAFGSYRLLFGSDWPVCLLAADYARTKAVVTHYLQDRLFAQENEVWYQNAVDVYNLEL